ncbi:Metal-dependent phosphohydrolase HD sub domain protein [Croceitalea dokdonensis DOKDO 023]|uniref:Metal-dependent phosphohydrolase HD sub domain protein n=1 Tax=Croceitalea dokdonensis DOKDO 023 TaxID=1300341 RepID=A0A0P7A7I7_9FLAO|nr:Pycsar system effector family protein [Croceitalea dokdonensis]KPM32759.1 Metal-dependent phosphohydrolase HD sub domain protein [Croceitalea dokdonensis DOKDO 023]
MPDIVQKAKDFVSGLLKKELDPNFLYHNLRHTQRVVKSTQELLSHSTVGDTEKERILLAAWLHDTGYTKGVNDHEAQSCAIAREFLANEGYNEDGVKAVNDLIMATKRYHEPKTLPEKIIRDADASHFAQNSYWETSEYLREELALLGIANYTPKEWRDTNIKMFRNEHQYYTDHALANWTDAKEKNLKKLLKEKKVEKDIAKKEALKAKYKSESPDRGIQTLFRVTLKNHITLSDIADTKANILLSVNAIIISVALSNLLPKLDNPSNSYLIYPTAIFVIFSVISMILAVLATRPNVTSGKFTKADVAQQKVNLLFFGNFHQMSLKEYEWAIQELVKDKDYIYSSLTKDLYFLGLVLNRKYNILRWTYTIFIIGIIISVLAFGISFHLEEVAKAKLNQVG